MAAPLPVDLNKVDSTEAWKPWTPTADEPWDRKRAAPLFRRAAFGATPAEITQLIINAITRNATQATAKSVEQSLGNLSTSGGKIGGKIKGLFGK